MRKVGPFWLFAGEPRYATDVRACTGHLLGENIRKPHIVAHHVDRWYGVAYRRRWLIGFIRFGETREGYDVAEPQGARHG